MNVRQILGLIFSLLIAGIGALIYLFLFTYRFIAYALWGIAAVFLVFLLLGLLDRRLNRTVKVLRLIFATVLSLGILAAGATALRITATATSTPAEECSYLIVLGCAVNEDHPSQMLQYRITAAFNYLNHNPRTKCIVSGGLGSGDSITEAQCMFNELTKMGIDSDRIILEEKATSTLESMQYAIAIIKQEHEQLPDHIGVLSSEFHVYRAQLIARDIGVPVQTVSAETERPGLLVNYYIREILALWRYIILVRR